MQWINLRGIRDDESDDIVGVLLGMLDYQRWINSIFLLKRSLSLDNSCALADTVDTATVATVGYCYPTGEEAPFAAEAHAGYDGPAAL